MSNQSFSLKSLFLVLTFAALSAAALSRPSPMTATITCTVSLVLMLSGIVAIAYSKGIVRAFYVGFSLFSWGYLAVALRLPFPALESRYVGPLTLWFLMETEEIWVVSKYLFALLLGVVGGCIARCIYVNPRIF